MKFALFSGMTGTTWDELLALWRHGDQTGWDAAGVTTRLRVGTIVSGNTYRHPALLAKMATNVDIISRGRLICGVGAGWQENEHRAYGMDFYTTRERRARLDEACHVMKALWTQT